jgi:hypothetical protein
MAYGQPYYGYYPQYQNGAVPDMLNQYKGQYQQMPMQQNIPTQQMQMPIHPTSQKPSNELIWVQGLEGAKGFLVAPNNTVVLWDTENPVIYVKSADASGIPSMRVLDFKERNGNSTNSAENTPTTHKCTCGDKFATKQQVNDLKAIVDDLTAKYKELLNPIIEKPKATSKKTKESEE